MSQPPTMEYATPQGPPRANGFAIASLVLSLTACVVPVIGALLGIAFGIVGLVKAREPGVGGKGLSIAGVVIGSLNVLVVPLLLIAILLPGLNKAYETANRIKCASNMRQIGQAMLLYANENQNVYPDSFGPLLETQDITARVFLCPSTTDKAPTGTSQQVVAAIDSGTAGSYLYFGKGLDPSAGPTTVLVTEPVSNHTNGGNVLYGDGHVAFATNLAQIIADLKAGKNPPTPASMKPLKPLIPPTGAGAGTGAAAGAR